MECGKGRGREMLRKTGGRELTNDWGDVVITEGRRWSVWGC